jgi:WD40 repeat protein
VVAVRLYSDVEIFFFCCRSSRLSWEHYKKTVLIYWAGDNTARIWDADTGTPVHTLKGHSSWVLAVSWSPDDTRIATGR